MRTKTLLLIAAVSAAGVATSMAQAVYSVNAVGYVKVNVQPGFQMIANPLKAADNTVGALLPGVPAGTTVYKFDSATGQYDIANFIFGSWQNPGITLNPGEGAFIFNPTQANIELTFVGEVEQGALSNPLPAGFSVRGSQVPQAGLISSDLGFPAAAGDAVYQFNPGTQGYEPFSFIFGSWQPAEPSLAVGESVFVSKAAAGNWTRTFSVNP
jgi:hypothetical protein